MSVLEVADLSVAFGSVRVVEGVNLSVARGERVGIVGESGSGKTMTARAALGLLPPAARVEGHIRLEGEDVLTMKPARLRAVRGARVAMVFQDPMTSFNPVLSVGNQLGEAITVHRRPGPAGLRAEVAGLLGRVGIDRAPERSRAYPHQFSGGMRQRALTAMAIANDPALLVADEPTTALDVTVQDQVVALLRRLNAEKGTAILLITHSIAVVASLCERIVVMYAGRMVEDGPAERLLRDPQHPYTWSLLQSVPRIDRELARLVAIPGQPPDPAERPAGCAFSPRCPFVQPRCREAEPPLAEVDPGRSARCWVLMRNVPAAAA